MNREKIKYSWCILFLIIFLLILNVRVSFSTESNAGTKILIYPEKVEVSEGDNFTLTVTVSNVNDFFAWQVVLKYNGSLIKCTDVWIPEDNVFAGHVTIKVEPEFYVDFEDRLNFLIYASSLVTDSVNVLNGVLFKVNFTAIKSGLTVITLATKTRPARIDPQTYFETILLDYDGDKISFSYNHCSVHIGSHPINLKPFSHFSINVFEPKEDGYIIIKGPKPVGVSFYTYAYKGHPVIFNATRSFDPDGNITSYIWDFGDGNITVTSTPIVIHIYNETGKFTAKLVVVDDGDPPLTSEPYSYVLVVGLILERYDWRPFQYGFVALIVTIVGTYYIRRRATSKIKN